MLNFIVIDLQLYKLLHMIQVSFFGTHCIFVNVKIRVLKCCCDLIIAVNVTMNALGPQQCTLCRTRS